MELTNQEIEDERRRGRTAGIATLAGVVLFIVAMIAFASDFNAADQAEQLRTFESVKSDVLIQVLIQALAVLLFIPALVSLFRSIRARAETVRPGLIGLVIASPILLALSLLFTYFAFKTGVRRVPRPVRHLRHELQRRRRHGLLRPVPDPAPDRVRTRRLARTRVHDRLHGPLLDANGPDDPVLGNAGDGARDRHAAVREPDAGRLHDRHRPARRRLVAGDPPPAWDAGKAMPPPAPGRPGDAEPREDELAAPEDFEGSATELPPEPAPEPDGESGPQKRKRKRRT